LIVPDVEAFPGHIACSSLSRSEIVVPILRQGEVIGVLDADSVDLNAYNEEDQRWLEQLVAALPL
jgi:GAF domain-containing protein